MNCIGEKNKFAKIFEVQNFLCLSYLWLLFVAPPTKLNPNHLYAFSWEDGMWCRTKLVTGTGQTGLTDDEGQEVHVCYPDYGNYEIIKRDQLRKLPKEFYNLPFQVSKIHVKLRCT